MTNKKTDLYNNKLAKLSLFIFLGLLAYMPFHVFITNWIGFELGWLNVAKAIKEPVMLFGLLLILYAEKTNLKKIYKKDKWLYVAIFIYSVIVCLSAFIFNNNHYAEAIGITYDLRLFVFFIYGVVLASRYKNQVKNQAVKIVLFTGIIVALLGVLQVLVLPDNALVKVGYSRSTGSQQVFYIHDDTKTTERAFSTIKDPNALGAYLGVIFIMLIAYSKEKIRNTKNYFLGAVILVCLYLTYSRSAWIGLMTGLIFLAIFLVANNNSTKNFIYKNYKTLTVVTITILVLIAGFLYLQPNTYKDVILHNKFNNATDSNTKRLDQYSEAVKVIKDKLFFGQGVGSAGPVSFKNSPNKPIISENYYLQIIEEYGLFGFFFFGFIVIYLTIRFYKQAKNDRYSLVMLTTLIIVLTANLFNHTWTIEAVAYTWWGLAGLFLYNSSNQKNKNRAL